ncbi:MAG: Co2+/Mg2+ efflux protein ApaG [Gammaproteobacteria bacterium]|jgi:ApaG protein|nr:Co2+/Mg2+ efflux protein ApaG [Chromatiales bacterium]MCP4925715.1 Co2+/Mg2+ efflux protein ApaG [Gammaproteobacteria bacterium]MDP7154336.1 Co2+/Mg2+ efflux protein ApaG [Gammaproteobacteria bacterium]MDP7296368.1 Co2+/Mg2+ efflux protein ApaG [Gammaproteobacteria bacterium]MDP7418976.1 Co2+/Mg2+ efflux protein ApaG [Gammaproteobacteria bacterium]
MNRQSIQIDVETNYLADQSDMEDQRYVFAYTVTIRNTGKLAVQLLTRCWLVTDAGGKVREIRGDGVVGEQPRIRPGEYHRYSSLSIITTPVGTMEGSYGMIDAEDEKFLVSIPVFRLAMPGILN